MTPQTPIQNQGATIKKKSPLIALLGVVAVLAVAVGGYFAFNMITTPTQVKQQVGMTHTVYKDYRNSMNKLIEDFLSDGSDQSTPESVERALQKTKDIVKTAQKERETLSGHVDDITVAAGSEYKTQVKKYLDDSGELITIDEKGIELFSQYITPLKKYTEVTVAAAGISQYMYSEPSKYVSELEKLIKEEESLIQTFKGMNAVAPYTEIHNGYVKSMEAELSFLQDMKKAVVNRDTKSLTTATQTYAQKAQDNSKMYEKAQDDLDTSVENIQDDLKSISDKIDEEYSSLQRKYSF
jgi:hypothetical protein